MAADGDAVAPAPEQPHGAGILITIRALLPSLAPVEQRVAHQVMKDPLGTAMRSISELARSCDTSATTVVRFCRALGLRGYPDLRIALAAAAAQAGAEAGVATAHDILPGDEPAVIVAKIGHADAKSVTDTVANLDIDTLIEVVDVLAGARRIDIYGVGASGQVALDLQQKLQRIGKPAFAWPDPHMAIMSAALLGPADAAVALSHTGTTIDTIDALSEAASRGAATVAITNFPRSPITLPARFVLATAARETAFRSGPMTSRITQLTVVDCLYVVLAHHDLSVSRQAFDRTFEAAQAKRTRRRSP